jgi:hypothetical protein
MARIVSLPEYALPSFTFAWLDELRVAVLALLAYSPTLWEKRYRKSASIAAKGPASASKGCVPYFSKWRLQGSCNSNTECISVNGTAALLVKHV